MPTDRVLGAANEVRQLILRQLIEALAVDTTEHFNSPASKVTRRGVERDIAVRVERHPMGRGLGEREAEGGVAIDLPFGVLIGDGFVGQHGRSRWKFMTVDSSIGKVVPVHQLEVLL